jgi:hypothetical protein
MATVGKDADPCGGFTMDPQAAWLLLVDALESGHWRVVREQAQDLLEWMEMGGFPPDISQGKVTDRYWNRQIAVYSCKLARLIARRRLRG